MVQGDLVMPELLHSGLASLFLVPFTCISFYSVEGWSRGSVLPFVVDLPEFCLMFTVLLSSPGLIPAPYLSLAFIAHGLLILPSCQSVFCSFVCV